MGTDLNAAQLDAAFLDALFEHAPVGLGIWDADLRYVRLNRTLADINGVPLEDHIGRTISEVTPKMERASIEAFEEVLSTGQSAQGRRIQGETPKAPGQERTWDISLYPIAREGEIVGVGAAVIEITDLVEVEQQLLAQGEHVYSGVVQSLVIAKAALEVGGQEPLVRRRLAQALATAKQMTTELMSGSEKGTDS
jgi:PAS domain S-box-containing protein